MAPSRRAPLPGALLLSLCFYCAIVLAVGIDKNCDFRTLAGRTTFPKSQGPYSAVIQFIFLRERVSDYHRARLRESQVFFRRALQTSSRGYHRQAIRVAFEILADGLQQLILADLCGIR